MRGVKNQKLQTKIRILEKTGGVCAVCGRVLEPGKITIEHYIPKYHGGTDDERNLLPLCKNCNKSKGSRIVSAEEYYPYLHFDYYKEFNEYRTEWEQNNNLKMEVLYEGTDY